MDCPHQHLSIIDTGQSGFRFLSVIHFLDSFLGWRKLPQNKLFLSPMDCFPGGSEVKASASNAGDPGSIPGSGRSPGEGNGNPLQYSCLENPVEGGAWWAAVHGVTESDTTERLPFHFLSLSPPSWGFSFALGCGVSLVVESNILLSMVVQW